MYQFSIQFVLRCQWYIGIVTYRKSFLASRLSSNIPALEMLSGSQTFKLSIHHDCQSCTKSLALFHAEISFSKLSACFCLNRLEVSLPLRKARLYIINLLSIVNKQMTPFGVNLKRSPMKPFLRIFLSRDDVKEE